MYPVKKQKVMIINKYKFLRFIGLTTLSIGLMSNNVCGDDEIINTYNMNSQIINEKKIEKVEMKKEVKEIFHLPTVDEIKNLCEKWYNKIKGTDKWNDLILKVAKKQKINPKIIKLIMSKESEGDLKAKNTKNKDGSIDYGLMQVNDKNGNIFDYDRMCKDPEYAIECGTTIIKMKYDYAGDLHMKQTIFNTLWLYNGYSDTGKRYAQDCLDVYIKMGGNINDKIVMED